jgi:hypothetical protein
MAIVTCLSPVAWKRTKFSNFQNLRTSQTRLSAASIHLRRYLVLSHPLLSNSALVLRSCCCSRIVTLVNANVPHHTHTFASCYQHHTTPMPSFAALVYHLHCSAHTTASFILCILSQPCRLSYCHFRTRTSHFAICTTATLRIALITVPLRYFVTSLHHSISSSICIEVSQELDLAGEGCTVMDASLVCCWTFWLCLLFRVWIRVSLDINSQPLP